MFSLSESNRYVVYVRGIEGFCKDAYSFFIAQIYPARSSIPEEK
jgi:hypothetical protein